LKPRVLQLVDSFDEGGSERQALQLTRLLHNNGKYEVFFASLKADGVLRGEIEKLQLEDIPSYPLRSFYDLNAARQLRRFVQHLRRSKIDILHTHDFYTNVFGMTAGFVAGLKVRIASRRETVGLRTKAQQKLQRVAYSLAHEILANSQSVRQKLITEGINENRITVIHNAVDTHRFTHSPVPRVEALRELGLDAKTNASDCFVTIVANMRHEVKDYPMFLRSAERVSKSITNAKFLLAGEGELQKPLRKLCDELNIQDRMIFLGRCTKMQSLLSASDVCVLSSKAEGFSNSILEYMAAGRPVVATDVGGASEAIVQNETGYLVPSGDDSKMAERIIHLLKHPETARSMGEKGRRIVEHKFSQRALLERTEALYAKVLDARSKTTAVSRSPIVPSTGSEQLVK
jgi:L-malate glycosyltransferase